MPDSRTQIVRYMADDVNGYNADVQYEGQAQYPRGGGPGGYQGGGFGGGGYQQGGRYNVYAFEINKCPFSIKIIIIFSVINYMVDSSIDTLEH